MHIDMLGSLDAVVLPKVSREVSRGSLDILATGRIGRVGIGGALREAPVEGWPGRWVLAVR